MRHTIKLRICCTALFLSLLISCLSAPVLAADRDPNRVNDTFADLIDGAVTDESEGTDGITLLPQPVTPGTRPNPKVDGFPDVKEADWFYSDVMRLVSEEIINGYPDGYFYPEREISNAEFIKLVVLSAGIAPDTLPSEVLFPGHWASLYISLAYQYGILTGADLEAGFLPDTPITRSAMTRMMILALGIEPARIDDPFTDISDMYASTAYNEYLLRGYLLEDDTRVYRGADNATRSEASAIAVRIIEYRADPYEYRKREILRNASETALSNEFELLDLFHILNREFMSSFTFKTSIPYETWVEYYTHSNIINIEYFYTTGIITSQAADSDYYTVTLEYDRDVEELKALHAATEEKADKVLASIITAGMSDKDKVKAIHDYLVLNCAYDYDNYLAGSLPFESRLGYGALCKQSAVCQGYCVAFNLLCKREGIRTVMVTGTAPGSSEAHSWNMVLIDGQIYYIDVTHDDPVPDQKGRVSYKYYMLTEAEMTALGYVWDKNHSNLKYFY